MEGLAGLGFILVAIWALVGIVFFFMILSIAIDCARLVRRANKIIDALDLANHRLAAISATLERPTPGGPHDPSSDKK